LKQKFIDNEVDGDLLFKLDRDHIRNTMGVTKLKEIFFIEEAISNLNFKREREEKVESGKKPKKLSDLPWQREGTHVDINKWKEDLEKTEYANELLNATEKDITNGLHHIPLSHWLQRNEKLSSDLFTRQCPRDLWNEVFMYLEATYKGHALVTGNPGIGKSRSMTYLLRMLLQNGRPRSIRQERTNVIMRLFHQRDIKRVQNTKCGAVTLMDLKLQIVLSFRMGIIIV
jgi:hypothetical protein